MNADVNENDPSLQALPTQGSRWMLAVPFIGKDVPSPAAEFVLPSLGMLVRIARGSLREAAFRRGSLGPPPEALRRERAAVLVDRAEKTRDLAVKLDRLVRLIVGRQAIANKGALQHGGKRMSCVGVYLTPEQVQK